ncbi:hypothetical protein [Gordonia sp. (in: high G+C Gram-positive bacteria)]|uniref:hypothetical protein n=1 Tax=Gordonia sp. (in: high G+C Gram-positive bacteria) TaxID=84139 RepID=UPI0039E4ACD5
MQTIKRIGASAMAASTIAAGAAIATATPAEAKIEPGRYTYVVWDVHGQRVLNQEIKIIGNRIFIKRGVSHVLHPTRNGAWYDNVGVRTTFWRAGPGYNGTQKPFWYPANKVRLIPGWDLEPY